jgi:NAD(P)-dependent dehydrogenase (short-subunit alcohol dehydrogenase family)
MLGSEARRIAERSALSVIADSRCGHGPVALDVSTDDIGPSCSSPRPERGQCGSKTKLRSLLVVLMAWARQKRVCSQRKAQRSLSPTSWSHEAEMVAADIRASGEEAMAAKLDVTNESEWMNLIAKVVATHGKLDILVNNAGISGSSVGDPDGLEGWHRIIAINQTSVFLGTKLVAQQMAKTGGGSIINISSIMGFVGSTSGHPAYHASKGAVRIYSKAAAVRYGPSGVRVNTVHPGYMPPMLNATNAGERDEKISATPLRRIGKAIEVAYGVLFVASDEEASFITGTELVIDGGFIAQ